jgi:hypothetical protein
MCAMQTEADIPPDSASSGGDHADDLDYGSAGGSSEDGEEEGLDGSLSGVTSNEEDSSSSGGSGRFSSRGRSSSRRASKRKSRRAKVSLRAARASARAFGEESSGRSRPKRRVAAARGPYRDLSDSEGSTVSGAGSSALSGVFSDEEETPRPSADRRKASGKRVVHDEAEYDGPGPQSRTHAWDRRWLQRTSHLHCMYSPQLGDDVVYVPAGHSAAIEAVEGEAGGATGTLGKPGDGWNKQWGAARCTVTEVSRSAGGICVRGGWVGWGGVECVCVWGGGWVCGGSGWGWVPRVGKRRVVVGGG